MADDPVATTWDMSDPDYSKVGYPIIHRASALGYCIRRQVAVRLGYEQKPFPDQFLEWFRLGHQIEEEVISDLRTGGFDVSDQQKQVVLPITQTVAVVAHLDGSFWHTDRPSTETARALEVKSMGSASFDTFKGWDTKGVFQHYKWQTSVIMHALGLPLTVIVRERLDSDYDTTTLRPVKARQTSLELDKPFYSRADIVRRVLEIESWVSKGELPEVCSQADYPCPVFYLHPEVEEVSDPAVAALVTELRTLKAQEKLVKKEVADVEAARKKVEKDLIEKMTVDKMEGATKYEQRAPGKWKWEEMEAAMNEKGLVLEEFKVEGKKSWRVKVSDES